MKSLWVVIAWLAVTQITQAAAAETPPAEGYCEGSASPSTMNMKIATTQEDCQVRCIRFFNTARTNDTRAISCHFTSTTGTADVAYRDPDPVYQCTASGTSGGERASFDEQLTYRQCKDKCFAFLAPYQARKETSANCSFLATGDDRTMLAFGLLPRSVPANYNPVGLCRVKDEQRDTNYANTAKNECKATCQRFKDSAAPSNKVEDCTFVTAGITETMLVGRPGTPLACPDGQVAVPVKEGKSTIQVCQTPAPSGPNVTTNWQATKFDNEGLNGKDLASESHMEQANSFTVQSKMMYTCVDVSYNGRTDATCTGSEVDAANPECLGLAKSLANASFCREYFTPASLGCKIYGKEPYSMEEWVAFGTQFNTALVNCAEVKAQAEPKVKTMESLTEMVKYSPNGPVGLSGGVAEGGGPILMSTSSPSAASEGSFPETLNQVSSGASSTAILGIPRETFVEKTVAQESFEDIVMESPFAAELNEPTRQRLQNAVRNAPSLASDALFRERALAGVEPVVGEPGSPQIPAARLSTISGAPPSKGDFAGETYGNIPLKAGIDGTPTFAYETTTARPQTESQAPPRLMEAERIAAVAAAALARRQGKRDPASVSSEVGAEASSQPAPDERETSTLFDRVRTNYLKRADRMRTLDSNTAREVRKLGKPAFFKEL